MESRTTRHPSNILLAEGSSQRLYADLRVSYAAERRAANWDTFWRDVQRTFFRWPCLLSCRPQYDTSGGPPQRGFLTGNQRSPGVPARVSCSLPRFIEVFECSHMAPACVVV
ncbi:hypothetical protein MRX96_027074 [Rhipicephalus microplus]